MLYEGRVLMITGGGGGIGRATSLMAAKEGANIVTADINADYAGKVASEIEKLGREAIAMGTALEYLKKINLIEIQKWEKKLMEILLY